MLASTGVWSSPLSGLYSGSLSGPRSRFGTTAKGFTVCSRRPWSTSTHPCAPTRTEANPAKVPVTAVTEVVLDTDALNLEEGGSARRGHRATRRAARNGCSGSACRHEAARGGPVRRCRPRWRRNSEGGNGIPRARTLAGGRLRGLWGACRLPGRCGGWRTTTPRCRGEGASGTSGRLKRARAPPVGPVIQPSR
jgi:hypothetical protein